MATPRYTAREIGKGPERGIRIAVFRTEGGREEAIGEYSRNYGTNFACFFPFRRNGADYALYSPDYTCTRVMELPSCRDLGGEEPDSFGFCPVEYYIPGYVRREYTDSGLDKPFVETIWEPKESDLVDKTFEWGDPGAKRTSTYRCLTPLSWAPFGFVAGCVWGDDSSWKIQYLDLSRAHQGVVKRDDRFGYIVLPTRLSLADAILLDRRGDQEDPIIEIAIEKSFRLSGKALDEES